MRSLQITLLLLAICIGMQAQNASPLEREVQFHQISGKTFNASQAFQWAGTLEPHMRSAVAKGHLLKLSLPALRETYESGRAAISLQLPTGEHGGLRLKLIQHELLTGDFRIVARSGQEHPYRPGRFYRGIVEGSQRSFAAISIFEDKVMGVIETAEAGNMILGPIADDARGRYILYRADDLANPPAFECGSPELGDPTNSLRTLNEHLQSGAFIRNPANCVRVYLECEHDMFREKGSVPNTVDFMTGLFNVVATIYQNEQINTALSEIFVWDTPDYYPTTSSLDALNAFRATRSNFNGDVAHLVSRGAPGGGGIAWVDALCSPYNYAYSYISSGYNQYPAYSWPVNVIAHEMGHNLGSSHTHDCVWDVNGDGIAGEAFDGCGEVAGFAGYGNCATAPLPLSGGTVMSYCHLVNDIGINLSNGFGSLPGDKIRFEVGGALCLSACTTCEHSVSISKTDAGCNGQGGSAMAIVNGGTPPYTFRWSNGAAASVISGLSTGVYTVSVTDGSGCTISETVSILEPEMLTLNIGTIPESAPGANNGYINLTAAGGTAPYAYNWSNGSITQDLSGLSAGIYSVTVTDANGCSQSASVILNSDGCPFQVSSFPYSEGFESGSGYWTQSSNDNYNWTRYSGSTPTNRTGPSSASEGNYYYYIESSVRFSGSALLQSPCMDLTGLNNPTVSFSYHMYGADMGTLALQVSTNNGASWLTLWMLSGSQGNAWHPATVYLAGYSSEYTRLRFKGTVNDGGRGDMAIDAVVINGTPHPCNAPSLSVSSTPARCFGNSDGSATVQASLGAGPYSYAWPNGATTATASGLRAGNYTVTVTGANGCSSTATATVREPDELALSFTLVGESADGARDGAISLSVSGGIPAYAYAWSNGASTPGISGLSSGAYSVTVTDANGCTRSGSTTLSPPASCDQMAAIPYSESFETGFGLWLQSAADGFDWSRNSGGAATNNTGPSSASDGAFYAYTRSDRNNNNATAYLESPCFELSGATMPVFSFDYHMNGNQMGTLSLAISTDGGESWQVAWSRSGDQGGRWQSLSVSLHNYIGSTIRLRFAGTMGGRQSEMAIDNIGLVGQAGRRPSLIRISAAQMQASLFPNPANDRLSLLIESTIEGEANLSFIGQLGRENPLGTVYLFPGRNEFSLPVHDMKQGLHYLSIQSAEGRLVERFMIQR